MSGGKVAAIVIACVGGGVLIVGGGLFALGHLAGGSSGGATSRAYDVTMVDCSGSGGQYDIVGAQADVEVTNKTSRPHSYIVTVSFTDDSGSTQYATGTAVINDVAPGQAGRGKATSWQGGNSDIAKCKVTKVVQSGF